MIAAGLIASATVLKWVTVAKIALAVGECAISAKNIIKKAKK